MRKSRDLYNIIAPKLSALKHEEFCVLLINKVGKYILSKRLTIGNESTTIIDPKLIFRTAIENNASNIVLAHNHPSGNINPSDKDKQMTLSLIQASKSIKINIIDHLIISSKKYYSFADHNLINSYKIN
ncbi:MAG: JAB domain-containing protein [Solitalea-like symbiont of Acarus siro]